MNSALNFPLIRAKGTSQRLPIHLFTLERGRHAQVNKCIEVDSPPLNLLIDRGLRGRSINKVNH